MCYYLLLLYTWILKDKFVLKFIIFAPGTSTRKSTGHQLESLSIFKSLNTSSLKSTKSFYALRQSFLGYPEGRCVILSFEFLFKNSVEFLKVDDWLYSGRSGRGLGLAVKTASPSCTGISASPKVSISAFPLLMHFKKRQLKRHSFKCI